MILIQEPFLETCPAQEVIGLAASIRWQNMHIKKIITPVFKTKSSGTCFVFVSDYGFSTLPTKATVRESPPSFKASTTESMIVILSVMCIVPK